MQLTERSRSTLRGCLAPRRASLRPWEAPGGRSRQRSDHPGQQKERLQQPILCSASLRFRPSHSVIAINSSDAAASASAAAAALAAAEHESAATDFVRTRRMIQLRLVLEIERKLRLVRSFWSREKTFPMRVRLPSRPSLLLKKNEKQKKTLSLSLLTGRRVRRAQGRPRLHLRRDLLRHHGRGRRGLGGEAGHPVARQPRRRFLLLLLRRRRPDLFLLSPAPLPSDTPPTRTRSSTRSSPPSSRPTRPSPTRSSG